MLGVSYLPNLRGNAINAGIVVGLITTIITYFVIPYPLGIHMGGWGIIMNVLTIVIVQALTRDTATKPAVEYSHAMWDADIAREIGVAPLVDLKADPTDQNYGVSAKA
jgi:Na+/proline symporter